MVSAMHRALNSNRLYYCNMFILPWDTFQAYMQWLFDVLFRAEREIRIDEKVIIKTYMPIIYKIYKRCRK